MKLLSTCLLARRILTKKDQWKKMIIVISFAILSIFLAILPIFLATLTVFLNIYSFFIYLCTSIAFSLLCTEIDK